MKLHAAESDDEILRAALKAALLAVYNNQTINQTISYSYSKKIDYGIGSFTISKTFTYKINQTVISPITAATVKTAADNVDKIPAAYTIQLNASAIVNALPTEEAITKAKQDVANGLTQVPAFEGAGYSVSDGGSPTAYILLSGKKYEVGFNLLDPKSVQDNIIKLITGTVVGG